MSAGAALMIGAILVVSGPTVVAPLLRFIRPTERLRRVLAWEGSLIDPVGGILGAVVYAAVAAGARKSVAYQLGEFLITVGIGVAGAVIGIALLWFLLRSLRLGEVLGTSAQLACVVGVAAACDIVREDAGLLAAIVMGLAVANMDGFDAPRPAAVLRDAGAADRRGAVRIHLRHCHPGVAQPPGAAGAGAGGRPGADHPAAGGIPGHPPYRPDPGEREFTGWMAPRGIVAAATASTFSAQLAAKHVGGASKILPVTFVVIVATVALYGLTAVPIARRVGVTRPSRTRPLLVGGQAWVVDLACALASAGLDVLMWAGLDEQREAIAQAGLELAPGELLASATARGAELEGITAVLLLTDEDDFNALAAAELAGTVEGPVYRLGARRPSHGVVAPYTGGEILFGPRLTRYDVDCRCAEGARISPAQRPGIPAGSDLLFLVRANGTLAPVTQTVTPLAGEGDIMILLSPPTATRFTPEDGDDQMGSRR